MMTIMRISQERRLTLEDMLAICILKQALLAIWICSNLLLTSSKVANSIKID